MLTSDDISSIEDEFTNDVGVRVLEIETEREGTITGVVYVTPESPDDTTLVVLILWDGDDEARAIELPSQAIELMK